MNILRISVAETKKITKLIVKLIGSPPKSQNRCNSWVEQVLRVWASCGTFKWVYETQQVSNFDLSKLWIWNVGARSIFLTWPPTYFFTYEPPNSTNSLNSFFSAKVCIMWCPEKYENDARTPRNRFTRVVFFFRTKLPDLVCSSFSQERCGDCVGYKLLISL